MSLRMKLELSVMFLVVIALVVAYFGAVWTQWGSKITTGTVTGNFTTTIRTAPYSSHHKAPSGSNGSRLLPLSESEVDGVEKFVLFIGHTRSGHSFISATMDAHPNIVIANEYHVLDACVRETPPKWQSKVALFNGLYEDSYNSSKQGRSEGNELKNPRGYNLHVNTPWQGSFSQLRVIGDKDGGHLSGLFSKHPLKTTMCFSMLKETINIPIVILHVVRNPFDMIATTLALTHGVPNTRQKLLEGVKLRLTKEEIMRVAQAVFRKAEAFNNMQAITSKEMVIVEIHSENFIKHPREHIHKICEALNVSCPVEYVEACSEKAFRNISKSRQIIEWDDNVVKKILQMIKKFPFFSGYTLSSEDI